MIYGVLGYLLNNERELLLVLRKNEPYARMWAPPGGTIEKGETPQQAVVREVQEETALEVVVKRKIGRKLDIPEHSLSIDVFELEYISGKANAGGDAAAVGFFQRRELHGLIIAPPVISFFKRYDL
jgi:8-oxo-dGTP diphosphatase